MLFDIFIIYYFNKEGIYMERNIKIDDFNLNLVSLFK